MTTLRTTLVWLTLLALLAIEVLLAHVGSLRMFVPFLGLVMALVVALTFMRLGGSHGLIPIFAFVGVFWLCVMLSLGSLDSATRHDVFTSVGQAPSP